MDARDPAAREGLTVGRGATRLRRRAGAQVPRDAGAQTLMVNELYLSTGLSSDGRVATALPPSSSSVRSHGESRFELADALDACEKLARDACGPRLLATSRKRSAVYERGRTYSAPLEFLALLINGEVRAGSTATRSTQRGARTSRLSFGTEAIEYRLPTGTRVGAMLGIKEYPTPDASSACSIALLSAPFPFVLTQSFAFLPRQRGRRCCSGSSTGWSMPGTSPSPRPRSSRTHSMP